MTWKTRFILTALFHGTIELAKVAYTTIKNVLTATLIGIIIYALYVPTDLRELFVTIEFWLKVALPVLVVFTTGQIGFGIYDQTKHIYQVIIEMDKQGNNPGPPPDLPELPL